MSVSYEEAMAASVEYFGGDELAAGVFVGKYALRNEKNQLIEKSPDDMHRRLAKEFARMEAKFPNAISEETIYETFKNFQRVIPQGSPMSAVGNKYKLQSASNCFVIPPPQDSYAGILHTDQQQAQIMKRRGGVGFDISNIRPKGLLTQNAAGTTDGIGVFMERFSNTCREVAQGGRRGALMLSISCHHPEIMTFINIKKDLKKVTGANISIRWTDEFLKAVEENKKVELRFPVGKDAQHLMKEEVDAKTIWDAFVLSAHAAGEPGCLFWDTALARTPSDCYADVGYASTSTNPCWSGDTLIAVADGRNAVSISQLAEEGKDVPVYSVEPVTGKVSIKMGRNPRVTGTKQKLVRITLDDSSFIEVTANHKCLLLDGTVVEAKDLTAGMSLPRFTKSLKAISSSGKNYRAVNCDVFDSTKSVELEHKLIAKFYHKDEIDELYDATETNKWAEGGVVIHHKDYDGTNNRPENLQPMTWRAHQKYHAEHDTRGEKNGKYSGFTDAEIKLAAIELTKTLGQRFSNTEWLKYAKENGYPQAFSLFRKWPNSIDLAKECAAELDIDSDTDPRLFRTMRAMTEQGYHAALIDNCVKVEKKCETCSDIFWIEHNRREVSFCSRACSNAYINKNSRIKEARSTSINSFHQKRSVDTKVKQARIYSDLKFELKKEPLLKDWENACRIAKVSSRLKTKHGFKNWSEVQEAGNNYNHKVLSVSPCEGNATVYNITVDDNHTVAIITKLADSKSKTDTGIFMPQCGEIILSNNDSCRLLALNTLFYVRHPFAKNAYFDFEAFKADVILAQRLMDDLIELEIEAVDKIISKIKNDPENEDIKRIELDLWIKIREAAVNGRRTGLGVTAIGDMVAACNHRYGSKESIDLVEEVYKTLALGAFTSSVIMAKERGAFPVYDAKKEKGHPFLEQIWAADPAMAKLHKKHGRRNIALTTTAPTGSVSTMTQTSSGIEPVFMTHYKRRKKINPNDAASKVDFIDGMGDKWQEYVVYHHGVKKWMEATGLTDIAESPYAGATANEIDWEAAVDLQAAAQKWICHAISKTINLPNSATVEDINKVYWRGWKTGCKGVTVYRDGCRSGVLVSSDEGKSKPKEIEGRPTQIQEIQAPKRPEKLECDIHQASIKGTKWTVFVGKLEGRPYEIFAGFSEQLSLPGKYKSGKTSKIKQGQYDVFVDIGDGEELVIKNIVKTFDNPESAWATRMISTNLRHGVPVEFICDQLSKDGGINDVNKVLSRILKKYIVDGRKVSSSAKCTDCGSNDLVFAEGCMRCTSCGSSKCG